MRLVVAANLQVCVRRGDALLVLLVLLVTLATSCLLASVVVFSCCVSAAQGDADGWYDAPEHAAPVLARAHAPQVRERTAA